MEFCLVEGSGGGVSSVCLSTRAELELVEVWSWWDMSCIEYLVGYGKPCME